MPLNAKLLMGKTTKEVALFPIRVRKRFLQKPKTLAHFEVIQNTDWKDWLRTSLKQTKCVLFYENLGNYSFDWVDLRHEENSEENQKSDGKQ